MDGPSPLTRRLLGAAAQLAPMIIERLSAALDRAAHAVRGGRSTWNWRARLALHVRRTPSLAQGAEVRADVADEQIGRLHGGEVAAAVELRPVPDGVPRVCRATD